MLGLGEFLMNSRFDERASGYSRGEGCCMMVIKSLKNAIHDGDTIRAVIRGTGTNQDGRNFSTCPLM